MGKIIMQQFITLDGVMQAPGDLHEFKHRCRDLHLSARDKQLKI